MSRTSELYLQDIIECCENVKDYIGKWSFDEFSGDKKTIDAVVRNLEIIGEAVKNIPDEVRHTKPKIEWKKVARFRDVIVHHYFKVDLEVVWDVVINRLPELETAAGEILIERAKRKE